MQKYMVMQTVDVSLSYIYEGPDDLTTDEVLQKFRDEDGYRTCPVVDIDVLDWDRPWDSFKVTIAPKPLTAEQIRTALEILNDSINK
jgi:hypothetical protein